MINLASRALILGLLLSGCLEAADMPAATVMGTPPRAEAAGSPGEPATPAVAVDEKAPGAEVDESEELGPPIDLDKPGVVTMALKDAPLQTVLEQIVLNGNWDMMIKYTGDETMVTAFLSGTSLREALDSICEITDLRYTVRGRIIVFKRAGPSFDEVPEAKPRAEPEGPTN